jgi:hypothetical protein
VRCDSLTPTGVAVAICPDCYDRFLRAEATIEQARERRRAALAGASTVRYVTPLEAARVLGCTARRVRQLAQCGKLPVRRVLSRVWVSEDAVRSLIRESGPAA